MRTSSNLETWTPMETTDVSSYIDQLCHKLKPLLMKNGFGKVDIRFRIVIEEGAMNAWKHGNKRKPGSKIFVTWEFTDQFKLIIEDQGDGFNPAGIENPTIRHNIIKENGRGIFLIQNFASEVHWEKGGSKLIAFFNKTPSLMRRQ